MDWLKVSVLAAMLIFTGLLHAQNQSQPISLNLKNTTLKDFFKQVETKTSFTVVYRDVLIDNKKNVSINASNSPLNEVVKTVLTPKGLQANFRGNTIVVTKGEESKQTVSDVQSLPRTKAITGTVIDAATGEPVIGASVVERGTTNGVITDVDGEFKLEVPSESVLLISYVGYINQEIKIAGKTSIDVSLQEDTKSLDEVVVVGYGTQKKINLTGAVTQISNKVLQNRPVTQLTQALQGVMPNLNIIYGSGKPGENGLLNIRGNTSINGGSPLVLIDGIEGTLETMNINDVESVTMLKDASASAVYGARAAFGVILVTTKNGIKGRPRINYTMNYGFTTHNTNTDFITSGYWNAKINDDAMYGAAGYTTTRYSAEDYEELLARVDDKVEKPERPWVVVKQNQSGQDMYRYYGNFDWFNYFYDSKRPKQNHNISLSGASDQVDYLLSASYSKEQGIFNINPDIYIRKNVRSKIDIKLSDWLRINTNIHYFTSQYSWYGFDDNFRLQEKEPNNTPNFLFLPIYSPRNPDGTFAHLTGIGPYMIGDQGLHIALESGTMKGAAQNPELRTTFEAVLKPIKDLTITANYTYRDYRPNSMYRQTKQYYSLYPGVISPTPAGRLNKNLLRETIQRYEWNTINIFGNYKKKIHDHDFNLMLGYNQGDRAFKVVRATGNDLLSDYLNDLNLVTGSEENSGGADEWTLRGVFGRFNYNYAGKYLLELSGRYDGTSRFPKHSRFGLFPSFSVGWRASEEKFFAPMTKIINNLKIRYSYGTLGNQEVAYYAYISAMKSGTIDYLESNKKLHVINAPDPVASNLTWEVVTTNNLGLDINFFKGKLSFIGDIYTRDVQGMLTKGKTLPAVYGATEPKENAANLRTTGFELSLGWQDKFLLYDKPFSYNARVILSDYKAKITKFDNPTRSLSSYYEGQTLGDIWGYVYDGFFRTDEEAQQWAAKVNQDLISPRRLRAPGDMKLLQAGDVKMLDLNGDGIINWGANTADDPGDRRIIGNTSPRYSYGLSLGVNWYNFDINALFQGIGRRHWYPHREAIMFWHVYLRPYDSFLPSNFREMMWSPDNQDAYFPLVRTYSAGDGYLSQYNTMYLQDLAYCKLRNLTLGYTLPSTLSKKIKLNNLRVYLSGENLLTWTKLKTDYLDPESVMIDPSGRSYPMGKTLSCGLSVTF